MVPQSKSLICLGAAGFHHMAYMRWSEAESQSKCPLICVHGLTRNGRDFDALAAALSRSGPVLCPDIVGRGASDWLANPAEYAYPRYVADVASLIASLDAPEVDFLGTSMGGIIGMVLASQPKTPIRRLVLNDVGGLIPAAALERIGRYVGTDERFDDLAALATHLSHIHGGFGPLSDTDWRRMAERSHRILPDGRLALAYDPAIAAAFKDGPIEDVPLWAHYDRISCPTLLIRGARSDLLLAETAQEMTGRGPCATLYEVADAGHAPALIDPAQIETVARFLER
ncbi:MAG TPA: alpha/beta hydrolase [Stellaceae bacterium]|nr:alpha/beta hydrolase [Stellaceae bacterium]